MPAGNKITDISSYDRLKPSVTYDSNTNTFPYRLSELVFGSLLASYILGFVGFSANLVGSSNSVERLIGPYFLTFSLQNPTLYLLSSYVSLSFFFGLFTALIYFNYHQTILYTAQDQRGAPWDYVISLIIAFSYGFCMIMPLYTSVILSICICILFVKRYRVSKAFRRHLAESIVSIARGNGTAAVSPPSEKGRDVSRVEELINEMAEKERSSYTRSWSSAGQGKNYLLSSIPAALWLGVHGVMLILDQYNISYSVDSFLFFLTWYNIAIVSFLIAYTFRSLIKSTSEEGIGIQSEAREAVDEAFTAFVSKIHDRVVSKGYDNK